MPSKDKRIRDTKDFAKIYKKGSFFSSKYFNANFLSNRGNPTRLGFVVGKKVSKKAVTRNRLKRQLREAARRLYDQAPRGYDIVISVKKEAVVAKPAELETEIQKLFQRIGQNEKNYSSRY